MTESGPDGSPRGEAAQVVFEDADYRLAVIDLLGAVAYGELSAFERLVDDAKLAPTIRDKVEMSGMASLEFGHVARLHDRIRELGGRPVRGDGAVRGGDRPRSTSTPRPPTGTRG